MLSSLLFSLIQKGHTWLFLLVALFKRDLSETDPQGYSLLHYAMFQRHYSLLPLLLSRGLSMNQKGGSQGITPLRLLIGQPDEDILKALDAGLPLTLRSDQGHSLLFLSVAMKRLDLSRALLDRGIDLSLPDDKGVSPLHVALKQGDEPHQSLLISRGAPLQREDYFLCCLYYAVILKHYDCVYKMIEHLRTTGSFLSPSLFKTQTLTYTLHKLGDDTLLQSIFSVMREEDREKEKVYLEELREGY